MDLKLLGNKCTLKEGYRKGIVMALSNLESLDNTAVEQSERMVYNGMIKDPSVANMIMAKVGKKPSLMKQVTAPNPNAKNDFASMDEFHHINSTMMGLLDSVEKRKIEVKKLHVERMEEIEAKMEQSMKKISDIYDKENKE
jgi:hypothetical protein